MITPVFFRKIFTRLGAFIDSRFDEVDLEDILTESENIATSKSGTTEEILKHTESFILFLNVLFATHPSGSDPWRTINGALDKVCFRKRII